MKFKITWPNGDTTTEVSETTSVDTYAMERWGCDSAESVNTQYGIVLEEAPAEDPPAEDPPV